MEHSQRKIGIVRALGVLIVFFLTIAPGFSGSLEPSEAKAVKAFSISPDKPVFVGMDSNPLLRIAVHLPAGKQISYRNIQSTLNKTAIDDIEKLEVFYTGFE